MLNFLQLTYVSPCMRFLIACVLAWAGMASIGVQAQSPASAVSEKHVALPQTPTSIDISNRFYVAVDPSTTKAIAEMAQTEFKPLQGVFVAGYSANAYWLKFTVSDPGERVKQWWLELEPPFIDQVDFYESLGSDTAGKAQFRHIKTGDMRAFSSREVPNPSFVFQLSPKAVPTTYFVRLQSSGPIWVSAVIWHNSLFAGYTIRYAHWQAASYGAFLLLMLIALVQGLVFKDRVYLAFVAHVGVVLAALSSIIMPLYLPDDWYPLTDALPTVATCLSVTTYAVFCNYFVLSAHQSKVYRWLFWALAVVGLVSAFACISPTYRWIVPSVLAAKIIGSILPVIAISRRLCSTSWYDRLLWLGIAMYVPAQALLLWRLTSVAEQDVFWSALHLYTAALLVHMLLITFALGERVSLMARSRLKLKEQLNTERQLTEMAEKTAFDQRSFLSMVAHEMRGPLAVARLCADDVRRELAPASAAVSRRLDNVQTSLQQMSSLIAVCLTHEREGFAQPLSLNLLLTAENLRSRLHAVLSQASAARVRWPDGQDCSEPIRCNPALLAIAVRNMIENACRYDTSGAPVEVAWQVASGEPDQWRISVLDRGPGIPAEQLEMVFEPFTRASNKDDSGLGLGLYIVSRIASMHSAKAKVQPREGGGMAFSVAFAV